MRRSPFGIVVLRSVADGLHAVADLLIEVGDRLVSQSNEMAEKWNRENGVYDPTDLDRTMDAIREAEGAAWRLK